MVNICALGRPVAKRRPEAVNRRAFSEPGRPQSLPVRRNAPLAPPQINLAPRRPARFAATARGQNEEPGALLHHGDPSPAATVINASGSGERFIPHRCCESRLAERGIGVVLLDVFVQSRGFSCCEQEPWVEVRVGVSPADLVLVRKTRGRALSRRLRRPGRVTVSSSATRRIRRPRASGRGLTREEQFVSRNARQAAALVHAMERVRWPVAKLFPQGMA